MKFAFNALAELGPDARAPMLDLLSRHFAGVDAAGFASDLAEKTHALRLFHADGSLLGFSTIDYRITVVAGAELALIYSGDTIVDPSGWSSSSLGAAWVAAVLDLHRERGRGLPLWWLLLTSGVRTNRYLSVYLRRYHPAPEGRSDPQAAGLLGALARARFGQRYDAGAGVVRLSQPQPLLAHLDKMPAHLADDPQVRLFLAANPGHRAGDELASLCRLDEDNLNPAGLRALAIGRRLLPEAVA